MSKKKPTKHEECPKCGGSVRTVWTKGRMLQQECRPDSYAAHYCGWEGSPYTPEKKPIRTVKSVSCDHGGWVYEAFDKYGHTMTISEGFSSKAVCMAAAKREIQRWSKDPKYGKCTAIVWPPTTTVRGTRVKP